MSMTVSVDNDMSAVSDVVDVGDRDDTWSD